jgi:hypothetical protein
VREWCCCRRTFRVTGWPLAIVDGLPAALAAWIESGQHPAPPRSGVAPISQRIEDSLTLASMAVKPTLNLQEVFRCERFDPAEEPVEDSDLLGGRTI